MKSFATVVIAIALVAASVAADEVKDPCKQVDQLARTIMTKRQKGVAASDMVDIVAGGNLTDKQKSGIRAIVIDAYKRPSYQTEEIRDRTITEFANEYYVSCLEQVESQRAGGTPQ